VHYATRALRSLCHSRVARDHFRKRRYGKAEDNEAYEAG